MPASLKVKCQVIGAQTTITSGTGGKDQVQFPPALSDLVLSSGTGDGQIDAIYQAVLSFTGTTPQTLDLTALTGAFNRSIGFTRVKVLYIRSRATGYTANIVVGNAATNAWVPWSTDATTITLYGGSPFLYTFTGAGSVVDSSNRNLLITPSATQDVEICIAGLD